MKPKPITVESLMDLQRRLGILPPRSHERRQVIQAAAQLYGVSEPTLYRALRERGRPKAVRRADRGVPRALPLEAMERYCEIIAAIKVRTSNKKGCHLSTGESIRLLEEFGVQTENGFVKVAKSMLARATVDRYLRQWGYDRRSLGKQPPAVRFQADHSNDCWQFDLSPSDLKHVKAPLWIQEGRGQPTLMLFSVVDDRSGVAYDEYHCVYGEDVEAALLFLFNAMSPKKVEGFPFCGIPKMLYVDGGPVTKSHVFQRVMGYLGIEVRQHMPAGKDGRRVTARAKGKVERPFRTVKEMHETLYHFHEPQNEAEANAWLVNYLLRYNSMDHRSEPHSRIEDWLANPPKEGIRAMCNWDRFCAFARAPEKRKVGVDARVSVDGVAYEVAPELAGESVLLWWGVFDHELFVEFGEQRYGPYSPVGAPIPLNRFRAFKKSRAEERADRIEALAKQLALPRAALESRPELAPLAEHTAAPVIAFADPDPFQEFTYPNALAAKRAIADYLGMALAKLPQRQLDFIDAAVAETLKKRDLIERIQHYFQSQQEQ